VGNGRRRSSFFIATSHPAERGIGAKNKWKNGGKINKQLVIARRPRSALSVRILPPAPMVGLGSGRGFAFNDSRPSDSMPWPPANRWYLMGEAEGCGIPLVPFSASRTAPCFPTHLSNVPALPLASAAAMRTICGDSGSLTVACAETLRRPRTWLVLLMTQIVLSSLVLLC
jgi:hypothetical protein